MAEKLINITAPQYRCTWGACPAVYKFYGDNSYGIIGKVVKDPDLADRIGEGEAAVEIPADLLLSSLGVAELVEAAEPLAEILSCMERVAKENGEALADEYFVETDLLRALREALSSLKGGK